MLETTVVLAAEEGGNPLLPPVGEIIYGGIAFLVLFGILSKFVFPRVNQMLEERTQSIEGKLEQAERDRREARELRDRYREQINTAQDEADRIVAEARNRGEEARQEIIARAEEDAARRVARAEEQIQTERDRAVAEVRRDVGQLAVTLAERIVGESLNDERQQGMVDRFVDELANAGASQAQADGRRG